MLQHAACSEELPFDFKSSSPQTVDSLFDTAILCWRTHWRIMLWIWLMIYSIFSEASKDWTACKRHLGTKVKDAAYVLANAQEYIKSYCRISSGAFRGFGDDVGVLITQ